MRFNLKAQVDTPGEIVAGLVVDHDTDFQAARERLHTVRGESLRADQRHRDATIAIERLRVAVANGEASLEQLEAALVTQRAAAMIPPQYAPRIAQAEAIVDQARAEASRRVRAEAVRRHVQLRKIAEEVTPLLQSLCDAEAALDEVVRPLGLTEGITPPLAWPQTLDDLGKHMNTAMLAANSPRRV